MNLFLDCETTGLPIKGQTWDKNYMTYPRVVQIAWKIKQPRVYIIHQEGLKIPKEVTKIHGITDKMANGNDAKSAAWVFEQLSADANVASKIIGHNIYFDTSIIKAHVARTFGIESIQLKQMDEGLDKTKRIDTMRAGQKITKKWTPMGDLYKILFGTTAKGLHTADGDIEALECVYKELLKLGHI